ncbi:phosphatase 1 regulatory subunit 14B-like protein, partial [Euroglyphus maynei]
MSTKTQSKSLHHVNFNTDDKKISERKKRYLTAKYGQHQMNLIKKRLKVETWMYEQLQFLFDS